VLGFGCEVSHWKAHVLKVWFPGQLCSEMGLLGGDWIMRALLSSMDYFTDGVITW
jgi:hypothetical protein